jgi:molybdopterin-guanine dinucleotide biosynthesis protein A
MPAWATPAPAPATPPSSRRGLAVVLVVLAALGLAGGAYFVTSSGDDPASPSETVLAYRRAAERGDCPAVVDAWTDDFIATTIGLSRQEALDECEASLDVEDVTIHESELVSQEEGRAVVEVTWTGDESGRTVSRFDLVLVDGRWRIDGLSETSA